MFGTARSAPQPNTFSRLRCVLTALQGSHASLEFPDKESFRGRSYTCQTGDRIINNASLAAEYIDRENFFSPASPAAETLQQAKALLDHRSPGMMKNLVENISIGITEEGENCKYHLDTGNSQRFPWTTTFTIGEFTGTFFVFSIHASEFGGTEDRWIDFKLQSHDGAFMMLWGLHRWYHGSSPVFGWRIPLIAYGRNILESFKGSELDLALVGLGATRTPAEVLDTLRCLRRLGVSDQKKALPTVGIPFLQQIKNCTITERDRANGGRACDWEPKKVRQSMEVVKALNVIVDDHIRNLAVLVEHLHTVTADALHKASTAGSRTGARGEGECIIVSPCLSRDDFLRPFAQSLRSFGTPSGASGSFLRNAPNDRRGRCDAQLLLALLCCLIPTPGPLVGYVESCRKENFNVEPLQLLSGFGVWVNKNWEGGMDAIKTSQDCPFPLRTRGDQNKTWAAMLDKRKSRGFLVMLQAEVKNLGPTATPDDAATARSCINEILPKAAMDGVQALLFPLLRLLGLIVQDVPRVKLVGKGAKAPNLALGAFGVPPADSSLEKLASLLAQRCSVMPAVSGQANVRADVLWTTTRVEDYLRFGVWRFLVRDSPVACWRLIGSLRNDGPLTTTSAMDPASIRAQLLDLPLRRAGVAVLGLGRGTIRDAVAAAVVNRSMSPDR